MPSNIPLNSLDILILYSVFWSFEIGDLHVPDLAEIFLFVTVGFYYYYLQKWNLEYSRYMVILAKRDTLYFSAIYTSYFIFLALTAFNNISKMMLNATENSSIPILLLIVFLANRIYLPHYKCYMLTNYTWRAKVHHKAKTHRMQTFKMYIIQ